MTTTDDIEMRVRATIAAHLCRPEEQVKLEARLVEDLKADSLDLVELLQRLEEEFHTTVDEKRAAALRTVSDVVDYVRELHSTQVVT
jgi:acyl carrier protein